MSCWEGFSEGLLIQAQAHAVIHNIGVKSRLKALGPGKHIFSWEKKSRTVFEILTQNHLDKCL